MPEMIARKLREILHQDLHPQVQALIAPVTESFPLKDKWMVYGVESFLEVVNKLGDQ